MKNINWNYYDLDKFTPKGNDKGNTTKAEVDENRFIKSAMRFFGRHIENLICKGQGTSNWFLQGDSPFGDDTIIIDQKHNWILQCN